MAKYKVPSSIGLLEIIQQYVTHILEGYFFWHGKTIAQHPKIVIVICIILTAFSAIGLLNLRLESNPNKLWISTDSEFINVYEWKQEEFPPHIRPQLVMYEAENVLDKSVLLRNAEVYDLVKNISTSNKVYNDICKHMPMFGTATSGQSDWLSHYFRTDYCHMMESFESTCYSEGLFEIWNNDIIILNSKSQEDIYDDISRTTKSPVFGRHFNATKYLSDITWKGSKIVGAKASMQVFVNNIDQKAINEGKIFKDEIGLDYVVDIEGYEWESKFIEVLGNLSFPNVKLFYMTPSSLNRIAEATIFGDMKKLVLGFAVEYVFVIIMIGKFNSVEQRPILGFFGIFAVGLSIISAYGLCSGFGATYSPVCSILPFLLLGLGVDDMFIIIDAWNNLSSLEKKDSLDNRVGHALKHAGVSITIASLTNFLAFVVNVSSFVPAASNFYLFTSVGILCVLVYQTTFFTAWFVLDQKRLEDSRHGMFWFKKMNNWKPNPFSQKNFLKTAFRNLGKKLQLKRFKAIVLLVTFSVLGVTLWRMTKLERNFHIMWLVPEDQHLHQFYLRQEKYFPHAGKPGEILLGEINYHKEFPKLIELSTNLNDNQYIGRVNSWADEFQTYVHERGYEILDSEVDEEQFYTELGDFLFSERGISYKESSFKFNGSLRCIEPSPKILRSKISFNYKLLETATDGINAMDSTRDIVHSMNFSDFAEPFSYAYSSWENGKVIVDILVTTFTLALIIIFSITLCLLASLSASMIVLTCVAFSLIDLTGTMQWWGIYIESTSSSNLILALGLCVDYAAHVTHTFMNQAGTRDERMQKALEKMGPAVFNGGVSTFIAFLFLAGSKSHIMKNFFKCFLCVTIFGLFHGLIFLPVLLSTIGPKPYSKVAEEENSLQNMKEMELLQNPSNGVNLHIEENGVSCNAHPSQVVLIS